jgi:hypothetical protein
MHEAETPQTPRRQKRSPHLWIMLMAVLALAVLYPAEILATRRQLAGATLEPVFSHPGGYYDGDIQVKISAPDWQSGVIFTLDGRVPTYTVGSTYAQPIRLSADTQAVTVIRARTVLPGGELGPVVSASYFVGLPVELPVMSLILDPDDLWNPEHGIYANPDERGTEWERPVDVTYVDEDRRLGFHVLAGVRIHGGRSRGYEKKSLRLYFRQEYGVSRLAYPLFAGSDVQSFKRLVLHSGGQDYPVSRLGNWTLTRGALITSLASELGGYAPCNQPVLLFINGESWGIYHLRERLDGDFLADHYAIEEADFLEAADVAGQRNVIMGDREHWDHLMQFVEAHDLAEPANYAYVQSQIDVAASIDYNLLQIYAANTDWPQRNVRQFRPRVQGGRWHWLVWGGAGAFGANVGSRVDSNTIAQLQNYNIPETGKGNALLLQKLLENPAFLEQFLSRTADLLNTLLSPASVIGQIDVLAAALEPDIAYETARWSSLADWASNVQALRDFAQRRPGFVRQHLAERFDLSGTAQLAVGPSADGSGTVAVNGFVIPDLPWQGVCFQGIPVRVTAAPTPGFRFAGWNPPHLPQEPTITLTLSVAQTITPRFEPIGEDAPRPGDVVFGGDSVDRNSHLSDDWFELRVMRAGGVDLRGWRVTDNDTKTATDEGSLIFAANPALARVVRGTTIRVVVPRQSPGDGDCPQDDLNAWDRRMVLYACSPNLDTHSDPGFNLGPNDNLVLLAPGPTEALGDDWGIAFVAHSTAVTPASFGVLADGVLPTQ